jgi:hypothetical protein
LVRAHDLGHGCPVGAVGVLIALDDFFFGEFLEALVRLDAL